MNYSTDRSGLGFWHEKEVRLEAASRIDAVIANAFGVSRSVAQEWITQGKLRRDGIVVSKADVEVQPDDMISCRGQGRVKLLKCTQTRKERKAWQIVLFRSQTELGGNIDADDSS